jgi:hypothetical protein
MSVYNAIFGMHWLKPYLLGFLDISSRQCGRFRDCYLQDTDGNVSICILTRNSLNAMKNYREVHDFLRSHPNFLTDRVDDLDGTYLSYFFSVPETEKPFVNNIIKWCEKFGTKDKIVMEPFGERFLQFMEKVQTDPASNEAKKHKELFHIPNICFNE